MSLRRVALALLCALVVTGCSADAPTTGPEDSPTSGSPSSTTSPSSSAAPDPTPAPEEGTCHALSYDAALAPTAPSKDVRCESDHTSQTFHVGRLDRVVGGRLLAVDARRLQDQVATTCPDLLADHVGGTEEQQRLSMLRSVWFTPTLAQSDAGAEWFRCDAIAVARDSRLLALDGSLRGVLGTDAGRSRYGMCSTAEPGTDAFARVACAETHSWVTLRTIPVAGEDYPGEAAARSAGEEPCTAAAREQAADPLDFQWGYEWPTEEQWDAGQTYGICWVPAS